MKDDYDEPMVRLNESKLLTWLRRKTEAVRDHLASDAAMLRQAKERQEATITSQFDGNDVAFGATADRSSEDSNAAEALVHAVALVAEYLSGTMQACLCDAMSVDESRVRACRGPSRKPVVETPALANTDSWASQNSSAASNTSSQHARDAPDLPAAKKSKPVAPVAKAAKLAGAPLKKGQTTMMGFFAKPK